MANIKIDSQAYNDLKISGKILRNILENLKKSVKIGTNLLEIENFVDKTICEQYATASFKGYDGFPSSVCLSVNDTIVHGIPFDYCIKSGDLVSIDLGIIYNDMFTDGAITLNFSQDNQDKILCQATQKALNNAIKIIKPGVKTGDIGNIIAQTAEQAKLKVIQDLSGHGTGKAVHEKPTIYNFGVKNHGIEIKSGDVLAIEPMFSLKSEKIINKNKWSIKTKNNDKSAHFEHTVIVTQNGVEIIT
ncbi:MAG: Methionine aminopeptidase [Berkelbacteria bacterium GW2011_GWA2_35_9]|uniref:Methionine aminopeptidase n=1 Tax=Berkelbacteria bacterium GW2011_GWA2_35_9 TaxID=1618333 RepID=A0A0G0GBZ8_9BACT|nr:MAG: Methionine aminopeptidase [Berkelbacteria bacterium GW2011_GWA2_35_9]